MKVNNPAIRLWILLNSALAIDSSESCRSVWERVLGVGSGDTVGLLSAMADLHTLLEGTLKAVEETPEMDQSTYLRHIQNLRSPLDPVHFNSAWKDVRPRMREESLTILRLAGDWLQRSSREEEISKTEIDELRQAIETLLQEVLAADLPEDLREFMVDQLEELRSACLRYRLRGAQGLRSSLEKVAGALVLQQEKVREAQESSVGESFDKILGRFASLVEFSQRARELLDPYVPFIVGLLKP